MVVECKSCCRCWLRSLENSDRSFVVGGDDRNHGSWDCWKWYEGDFSRGECRWVWRLKDELMAMVEGRRVCWAKLRTVTNAISICLRTVELIQSPPWAPFHGNQLFQVAIACTTSNVKSRKFKLQRKFTTRQCNFPTKNASLDSISNVRHARIIISFTKRRLILIPKG